MSKKRGSGINLAVSSSTSRSTSAGPRPGTRRADPRPRLTLQGLRDMASRGTPISMLTASDAGFAALIEAAGADGILVSDSLGMWVQGHGSSLPVTVEQMAYHTGCVSRGNRSAFVVADLPLSSPNDVGLALRGGAALMQAGAQMVKLAGGAASAEMIGALTRSGIAVCAHLGLSARSVYGFDGQAPAAMDAATLSFLMLRAIEVAKAGAAMIVLEQVPHHLAQGMRVEVPQVLLLGMHAGPSAHGHLLDTTEILGLSPSAAPVSGRHFVAETGGVPQALRACVQAVRSGSFPYPVAIAANDSASATILGVAARATVAGTGTHWTREAVSSWRSS